MLFFVICVSQEIKAIQFATVSGLILRLGPHESQTGTVMKFDCEKFSAFPDEKEILFFGGSTKLKLKNIKQLVDNSKWSNYLKFLDPINAFNHLLSGQPLKKEAILTTKTHQKKHLLGMISVLMSQIISKSPSTATKIPKYIGKLMWFSHTNSPRIRLLYDELMKEYDWLHCILKSDKSEKSETIDIANIAVMCSKSKEIIVEMAGEYDLGEPEWKSLAKGMNTIQTLGLSMKIRVQLWTTESVWNRMYSMGNALVDQYDISCQQLEDGKVLVFDVNGEQYAGSDSASVAFDDRVQMMIARLTESEEIMKAPKKETSDAEQV